MRLTLLRAPVYPDPVCDKGEHDFVYSILPHAGDWRCAETVHKAYELNVPLMTQVGTGSAGTASTCSFACIPQNHVILDTIKGAEDGDGLIVRVYESHGARGKVDIHFEFALKDAFECNLMEENEREVDVDGCSLHFTVESYEIKTFRIHKA